MQGRHLKAEIKAVGMWRETKDTFKSRLKEMEPSNVLPLLLNLVSCFLFMCNNYIIEPSSAYYANALGSSDAMSGLMMGAAPWFALVSAIGYSYWTNYNYKSHGSDSLALLLNEGRLIRIQGCPIYLHTEGALVIRARYSAVLSSYNYYELSAAYRRFHEGDFYTDLSDIWLCYPREL
jgi:hypothetical protein